MHLQSETEESREVIFYFISLFIHSSYCITVAQLANWHNNIVMCLQYKLHAEYDYNTIPDIP